ncbi:MAG: hypothetical protein II411_01500 [Lachnospiraceae bacterium]|nr:hypothetical protein [Lachnospiraceae bacterium]
MTLEAKNNIEIVEEKNIKNTFLYVKNAKISVDSYETKILTEDNIENIIKFQIMYEGENRVLRFDVSNTVSLEEFLKSYKLKKNDICQIIDSIDAILMSVENYLISENSVALDLKFIRVVRTSGNKFSFKFIAIPNYNTDFSYELSKFLIRILRFVDVEDKDALSLAYGLFVRSSKDNYTLNDLLELIDKVRDKSFNDKIDFEALNAYDEEIANEISKELIESATIDFSNEDVADLQKSFEKVEKPSVYEDKVIMDDNTRDIIAETLYDDFDKNDRKVVRFDKKKIKLKPKKVLSGHIRLGNIYNVFMPIAMISIPVLFYVFNGHAGFFKYLPGLLIYEATALYLYVKKLSS